MKLVSEIYNWVLSVVKEEMDNVKTIVRFVEDSLELMEKNLNSFFGNINNLIWLPTPLIYWKFLEVK
jgi:hypothetical protein